jgi:enoyl-CoA hydratase/carnithine racemase
LSAFSREIVTAIFKESLLFIFSFLPLFHYTPKKKMSSFPVALPSQQSHFMTLSQEGPLFILHLHHKDNRFTTEFCQAILQALQIVEDYFLASEEPADMALVTVGNDKIFSNGLDLMHAVSYRPFMDVYLTVLRRYLTFCIPTVAAING